MAIAAMAPLALTAGPALGQSLEQFWPEIQLHYRLDPQIVFMVFAGATRDTESGTRLDWQLGAGLTYRFDKLISVRLGYREIFPAHGDGNNEERLELDQNTRILVPWEIKVGLRTRLEGRHRGDGISFRVRERLQIERDIDIGGFFLTPYASGEAFFDSRYDKISKTNFVFGAVFAATHYMDIDLYASREIDRVNGNNRINGVGLTAVFNF